MALYKNLVPHADIYVKNHFSVLLISEHGIGKTAVATEVAETHGLKLKYYSCATMDPFTDLVGVPFPKETKEGTILEMVRPKDVDDAEFVFFDELNRADPRVQNAVFEMVQFKTINGEPLPNLKMVWAAINPGSSKQGYDVDELDPALVDRFDVYENIKPKPSVEYLSTKMPTSVARALVSWHKDHNAEKRGENSYVSPRRLEKIGIVVSATGSPRMVPKILPPGGNYDTRKLMEELTLALDPGETILYRADWIYNNMETTISFLKREEVSYDDQSRVLEAILKPSKKSSLEDFCRVLETIPGSLIESTLDPKMAATIYWDLEKVSRLSTSQKRVHKLLSTTFDVSTKPIDLSKITKKYVYETPNKELIEQVKADPKVAQQVAIVISTGIGVSKFVNEGLLDVVEAMPYKIITSKIVYKWGAPKKSQFRTVFYRHGGWVSGVGNNVPKCDYKAKYPQIAKALRV